MERVWDDSKSTKIFGGSMEETEDNSRNTASAGIL